MSFITKDAHAEPIVCIANTPWSIRKIWLHSLSIFLCMSLLCWWKSAYVNQHILELQQALRYICLAFRLNDSYMPNIKSLVLATTTRTKNLQSVQCRDGTRKLSKISDRKFSENFRKEISIPFRNHSIFFIITLVYIRSVSHKAWTCRQCWVFHAPRSTSKKIGIKTKCKGTFLSATVVNTCVF